MIETDDFEERIDTDYPDEPEDFDTGDTDDLEDPEIDIEDEDSEEGGKKKYAPLPPFDITAGESFLLYDNMKYVCDTDICNRSMIKKESGNVCKGYRVKEDKPIKIGGDA